MSNAGGASTPRLRVFDFIFILRPAALVPLWIFYVAGARLAARATGVPLPLWYPPRDLLLGLLSMTAVLGGGYLLNQIHDIETDRRNDKLFFLPREIVSVRAAWVELAIVWCAALLLAIPLSSGFRWVAAASLLLSITYSAPPVRAKTRAPLDLVWNALGFGCAATAAGWAAVARPALPLALPALSYSLAVAGVIASTTILDVPGDRAQGMRTTGAVLGERGTSVLAISLLAAGAAVGVVAGDRLAIFGPVLSIPLMALAMRTGARKDRVTANQVAVAVFALIIGAGSLYLLALLAIVFVLSRAYYRARFGIVYPGRGTP